MLCIVAIVAVHYTHINTCYVLLLYTTHIATHAMYCCYCCCALHSYQHMLCIVAVHYTHSNTCYVLLLLLLCTTHINTCYVLLLYTIHISTHVMYCCYCCCALHTFQHMLCIVAVHYTQQHRLCIVAVHYTNTVGAKKKFRCVLVQRTLNGSTSTQEVQFRNARTTERMRTTGCILRIVYLKLLRTPASFEIVMYTSII